MNSRNINLLPKKSKNDLKEEKILRIFKLVSFSFLALVCLISISLFFLNRNSSFYSLENEKDKILKNISSMDEITGKYLFTNTRLKDASEIVLKRKYMDKTINLILEKVPEGVSVDSIEADKISLTLSVSSKSLYSINILLNNLVSLVPDSKLFGKIMLSGITLDQKKGLYNLSLKLTFI